MRKQTAVKGGLIGIFVLFLCLCLSSVGMADMTSKDFVSKAKETIKEVSVADAKAAIDSGKAIVLDCRTAKEFKRGHVPGAINIPRGLLEFKVDKKFPDKAAYIIIYCKSGGRSCLSTCTLGDMGYTNIASMDGGWKAWIMAGYPME